VIGIQLLLKVSQGVSLLLYYGAAAPRRGLLQQAPCCEPDLPVCPAFQAQCSPLSSLSVGAGEGVGVLMV
jgi:hypothetical protein